jgi:NAD(P)-dependent dehydrogenase (short-subunit alcohol dehydrogenase family)
MRELEGRVAIVAGGEGRPRAAALALAARGVRILVVGPVERTIAETVGHIAYGGGKARHLVTTDAKPAVARAVELFGRLDFVVDGIGIAGLTAEALPELGEGARIVSLEKLAVDEDVAAREVVELCGNAV